MSLNGVDCGLRLGKVPAKDTALLVTLREGGGDVAHPGVFIEPLQRPAERSLHSENSLGPLPCYNMEFLHVLTTKLSSALSLLTLQANCVEPTQNPQ